MSPTGLTSLYVVVVSARTSVRGTTTAHSLAATVYVFYRRTVPLLRCDAAQSLRVMHMPPILRTQDSEHQPTVGFSRELARVDDWAQGPVRCRRTGHLCVCVQLCTFTNVAAQSLLVRVPSTLRSCARISRKCLQRCARRNLYSNKLWGSLPSSLASLTGLTYLYVGVVSASASARGTVTAHSLAATVYVFCRRTVPLFRCEAAPSLQVTHLSPILRTQHSGLQPTVGFALECARADPSAQGIVRGCPVWGRVGPGNRPRT